jgi:hypothetical protein
LDDASIRQRAGPARMIPAVKQYKKMTKENATRAIFSTSVMSF